MIKVAYDLTSAAQSQFGGIATVCRETMRAAIESPDLAPLGFYMRGSAQKIGFDRDWILPYNLLSQLFSPRHDIVHSLCHRRLRLRGKRKVYTLQDAWSLYPNKYQSPDYQKKIGRRIREDLANVDLIVVVSKATQESLLQHTDTDPDKVAFIPNGVRLPNPKTRYSEAPKTLNIPQPFVLFVGRLEYRKNIPHILEAVSQIPSMHLVMVGEPGFGFEESVREPLAQFPQERLHHFASVDKTTLSWLYQNAIATLVPSWEEGFGMPILEAMAHGSPVITSNRSACLEIAEGFAVLVSPDEPQESKVQIERLIEDSTFRDQMIAAGKTRASQFGWNRNVESLVALYTSILNQDQK